MAWMYGLAAPGFTSSAKLASVVAIQPSPLMLTAMFPKSGTTICVCGKVMIPRSAGWT